jgi:hypothetical protein
MDSYGLNSHIMADICKRINIKQRSGVVATLNLMPFKIMAAFTGLVLYYLWWGGGAKAQMGVTEAIKGSHVHKREHDDIAVSIC